MQLPSVSTHCVEQTGSETLPPTCAPAGSIDTVSFLAYIEPNVAAKIGQLLGQSWLTSGQSGWSVTGELRSLYTCSGSCSLNETLSSLLG